MILRGNEEIHVPDPLQIIRQQATITKIITEEQDKETWLNQEYTEQDIARELRKLTNRQARGCDGIPGETYKATRKRAIAPIAKIMNELKEWQEIPENWIGGAIVYIYKNQGDTPECGKYRPIFPARITYKI